MYFTSLASHSFSPYRADIDVPTTMLEVLEPGPGHDSVGAGFGSPRWRRGGAPNEAAAAAFCAISETPEM